MNPTLAENKPTPPPAQGVRSEWSAVPAPIRAAFEQWLGSPVVSAVTQPGGFSPGVAARLTSANERRVFVKALSAFPNPGSPGLHRQEARVVAALPPAAPVPRLLWSYDEGGEGWIVLVFEDVEGRQPAQPWQPAELERVLAALNDLADFLTPSPLPAGAVDTAGEAFAHMICGWRRLRDECPQLLPQLDAWTLRHLDALIELEAAAPAAVTGNTLLQFDLRADNLLLTPEKVWVVDWPHARVGAAWVDALGFFPSVAMQGGPQPEELLARVPACSAADPAAVTACVASMAGYFFHRGLQPPPPGLPTLRPFQLAQGVVTLEWLVRRTGWD